MDDFWNKADCSYCCSDKLVAFFVTRLPLRNVLVSLFHHFLHEFRFNATEHV